MLSALRAYAAAMTKPGNRLVREAEPAQSRAKANRGSRFALTAEERAELDWIAAEGSGSHSRRARMILLRAEGRPFSQIARQLGADRATVRRWVRRFEQRRLAGLAHASAGKARKRRLDAAVRDAIVRIAVHSPRDVGEAFEHWSLRRLQAHVLRRGIVGQISVEGLRQLLQGVPLPPELWQRSQAASLTLTPQARAGLEQLAQEGKPEAAKRARIVLARASGLSEAEVAAGFGVGRLAVRRWVRRFRQHGVLGLQTQRRGHGPSVFTTEVRKAILQVAETSPRQFGVEREQWSLRTLRAALVKTGIVKSISVQHLRRILEKGRANKTDGAEGPPALVAHA